MIFGYENESNGIQDGDIVTVMFLERDIPPSYKKKLAEREKISKENTEILGVKIESLPQSIKEGGIAYHFAIIERFNDVQGKMESLIKQDENNLVIPDYNIFGMYIQNTPDYIFENKLGYPNIIKGGLNRYYTNSKNIVIGQHFPGTYVEKDWDSGVRADEVSDDELEKYVYLVCRENKRKANWQRIIDKWHTETEELALCKLEEMISSRLLLYKSGDNKKPKYLKPQKGMCIKAKVKKIGIFIDLIAFVFDRQINEYIYYSNGTEIPDSEDLSIADMLIEARDNTKVTLQEHTEYDYFDDIDVMPF